MLRASLDRALDRAISATCVHCAALVDPGSWAPFLCRRCAAALRTERDDAELAPGVPCAALFRYQGPARSLIRALKFEGNLVLGRRIGRQMRGLVGDLPAGGIDLVPVPLHWRRRWLRGHNQADTLARALAGGRPGLRRLPALRRRRATPPQVGLAAGARRRNVVDAFAARWDRLAVSHRRAVVVDDVVTTGATASAALETLRGAGVEVLAVFAAARARRDALSRAGR